MWWCASLKPYLHLGEERGYKGEMVGERERERERERGRGKHMCMYN